MKKRILFVDDEPYVLAGLRRMLRGLQDDWEMHFVCSAREALERMNECPFDVIVSDIRMPDMDGVELLTQVMNEYPGTVRIALSGHCSQETFLRSAGPAHQFMAKPCDPAVLKATVTRACALRDRLTDKNLMELVAAINSLPSMPTVYQQIVTELKSPRASAKRLGELISHDVAMTAKILQLVNSAFFGLQRRVTSPVEATVLLGMDTVKTLALGVGVFSLYSGNRCQMDALIKHSFAVAVSARRIAAQHCPTGNLADDAFMAGLLHDVGRLVLIDNFADAYEQLPELSQEMETPLWRVEREVFGATHAELGASLLEVWGLPDRIVEAVAFHHTPIEFPDRSFSPLTAVHVANALHHERTGIIPSADTYLDCDYLTQLGVLDRMDSWRALVACDEKEEQESSSGADAKVGAGER